MIDVNQKIADCQVMAEANDVIVHCIALDHMVSQCAANLKVLELGAGSGGWTRVIHSMEIQNIDWLLLEDFRWADAAYDTGNFVWPTNKEELITFVNDNAGLDINIECVVDDTVNNAIQQDLFLNYKNNISAMRIDCDISVDAATYFIDNVLNENGIIIIDDCKINCGLQRILLGTSLVTHDKLHPIWFGEKEAMYCKNYELSRELQNVIYNKITEQQYNGLYVRREYAVVEGKQWNNICTTKFPVS